MTDVLRHNTDTLRRMLANFAESDRLLFERKPPSGNDNNRTYALSALNQECQRIATAVPGERNPQLFRSAAAVANLVAGGGLDKTEAETAIMEAARSCGLLEDDERTKTINTIARAFAKGSESPRQAPERQKAVTEERRDDPTTSDDPLDEYATALDLRKASVEISWLWEKWLPRGVLTVIASEPGVGKTRFCLDLARRIHRGMPWPDGQNPTCPVGSRTLWVPADNQHPELATIPEQFGFPPEALFLNATKRNPFAGTMLDSREDLKFFEKAIAAIQPQIVFVDTVINATDKSAHKPEDAKALFKPLQEIAARQQVAIVCVTHLNADGKPLGRRIVGQARLVMQLERPDPDGQPHRRKLHVVKSNALMPPALGVTMYGSGNDYDATPPEKPEDRFGGGGGGSEASNPKAIEAAEWLKEQLALSRRKVGELRGLADELGINARYLYQAKKTLGVIETVDDRTKKWWELPTDQGDE